MPISSLHKKLRNVTSKSAAGRINLYSRFKEIKERAKIWLKELDKNGYEHSERLEMYLDALTKKIVAKGRLTSSEIFILLCSVYMHDVGYIKDGEQVKEGHAERSYVAVRSNPESFLLGDFPRPSGSPPFVAEAVALVCRGHAHESVVSLCEIPYNFADAALSSDPIDLRKLVAFLRLADEADDPYIRLTDSTFHPIRSHTPLVKIGDDTIVWHWQQAGGSDPTELGEHIKQKQRSLRTAREYIQEMQGGSWYLVLEPQVSVHIPFMVEKPTEIFVGREKDLENLHRIIQERKEGAITGLVGIGGIGKTELAKKYAWKYRESYPGGIFWAFMKGGNWKTQARKIINVLQPGEPMAFSDDATARAEVTTILSCPDALLIIDNVDEADQIINPACFTMVTTREKWAFGRMPRQAIYELSGLPPEKGIELFEKILGKLRVQQDRQGAERIIEILGGMPLALEIAAGHLYDKPGYGFPSYIGDIQGRIDKLQMDDNHDKNVLASLELSLEQLKEAENSATLLDLFEAASICSVTGFTYRTLCEAAGLDRPDSKASGLVGKLHFRSLLEFDVESSRYTMHPLLLQISALKIHQDADKEMRFRENHCRFFLDYAAGHDSSPSNLIEEQDGLWQAMVQAHQLNKAGDLLPNFIEYMSRPYQKMIDARDYEKAFSYLEASNLINIAELGMYRQLVDLLQPLLDNKDYIKESSQEWVFNSMGLAYGDLGELKKAIQFYEQALEIDRRIGDVMGEGNTLGNMGLAYRDLGEFKKSIQFYEQRLEIARRIGDIMGEGIAFLNMGNAYTDLGEYKKALQLYEQALEIDRRIGNVMGEGYVLDNMGCVYLSIGESKEAIQFYEPALEISRRIGDVMGEGYALCNMGIAYGGLGEFKKAIQFYEPALEIFRRIGYVIGEGYALCNMGIAYRDLGEYKKAILLNEQALEISRRIGDVKGEGYALLNMGNAYRDLGEYKKAILLNEPALEIFRRIGDVRGEGYALFYMGNAYRDLGEYKKAIDHFEESITIFKKYGLNHMASEVESVMDVLKKK
jgi:tetratricopeptide (TPR) repeat protein